MTRRRALLCAVAPAVVALAASVLATVGSLRMTQVLGDGAATVAEAAAAVPRVAPEPAVADDDAVDYDAVTRRVFGEPCPPRSPRCDDLWASLDDAQRGELRILVAEVVRIAVRRALEQPPDVRVEWVRERTPRGERVVDVVTEGSSLTHNYYAQIGKMMRDPAKGYPFVVERLRRKIARSS